MLMQLIFRINNSLKLNRKNLRFRYRQKMIKAKKYKACAKSCMIKEIVNILLNLSNHQIENAISKKKVNKKCDFEITIIFSCTSKNC